MKSVKITFMVSVLVALMCVATVNAADVAVAGFWGVGGDTFTIYDPDPVDPNYQLLHFQQLAGTDDPCVLEYVMDLGEVIHLEAIGVQNRCVDSIYNPKRAEIYVAADESDPGFDPCDAGSFTVQINVSCPSDDLFNGDIIAAHVKRYINVNLGYYRQYVMVKITESRNGPIVEPPGTNYWVQFQDVVAREACFWGVGGDTFTVYDPDPVDPCYQLFHFQQLAGTDDPNVIEYVMDLGEVISLGAIGVQNRCTLSWHNPKRAKIYVAADESDPGFDPFDADSFTVQINLSFPYDDIFSGSTSAAHLERYIDVIPGYDKRYAMVKITESHQGPIEEPPGNYWTQFQDVLFSTESQQEYPEAGLLFGLPDSVLPEYSDTVSFADYPGYPGIKLLRMTYLGGLSGDMRCDVVIDQFILKDIQKVYFTNLEVTDTLFNTKALSIWVAPESGPGSESGANFDRMDKASYSMQIFPQTGGGEGVFADAFYTVGLEREADVTDVGRRRYLLMSIKSNFWGDMGTNNATIGYNYYSDGSDVRVQGLDSIACCGDVLDLGLSLTSDVYEDCYVNMLDLGELSSAWLACTEPGEAGCIRTPDSIPTYYIEPVPAGGITVDGSLNEWPAGSEWIYLDKVYSGVSPYDVKEAKFSLRWDGDTDKIYLAVIVDDPDHNFSDTATYTADLIEIYSQGDAAGGTGWGAGGTEEFDVAQQYFVGHDNSTGHWSAWADLTAITGANAEFESAVTLDGDNIIYEIGIKQFDNYGDISGEATVVTNLASGVTVGFDVIADTVHGSSLFSMLSENAFTGKYWDADQFQQYELANTLPQQYCGDWGYLDSDIVPDCYVNLKDFAAVVSEWLNCNDPENVDCVPNW